VEQLHPCKRFAEVWWSNYTPVTTIHLFFFKKRCISFGLL